MTPRTAGLLIAGGALTMLYLERFTKVKNPGSAERIFVADDLAPTRIGPQPPAPAFAGPRQLPPGPIQATPGMLYRATVRVSFPLSMMASASKTQGEAQKRGFSNVSVTTSPPPGWPGAKGDYYVTGVYQGVPKFMDRSAAAGQVNVIDVWQG